MRVYVDAVTSEEAIAMVVRGRHGRPTAPGGKRGGAAAPRSARPLGPVLLRVQDQCVTSEVFGSLKCDCKQQLDLSMARIQDAARVLWEAAPGGRPASAVADALSTRSTASVAAAAGDSDSEESDARRGAGSGGAARGARRGDSAGASLLPLPASDSLSDLAEAVPVDGGGPDGGSGVAAAPVGDGGAWAPASRFDGVVAVSAEAAAWDAAVAAAAAAAPADADAADDGKGDASDAIVGAVLYLQQEGRGVGIAAKVAAYALQEDAGAEAEADGSFEDGAPDAEALDAAACNGTCTVRDDVVGAGAHASPRVGPVSGVAGAPPPASCAACGNTPPRGAVGEGAPRRTRPRPSVGRGLDTVDANRALGLPDDSREYSAVRDIAVHLGLVDAPAGGDAVPPPRRRPLVLLTNNPRKVELLRALGVPVAARVPCVAAAVGPLAARYLRAKVERMGHDIPRHAFEDVGNG